MFDSINYLRTFALRMTVLKLVWVTILVSNIFAQQVRSQKTPMFYGWFFEEVIAAELKKITESYLASLYSNVEEVHAFLQNISTMAGITDPLHYYTKPVDPNTGQYDNFFHITAFYCGTDDCTNYSRMVNQFLTKTFIANLVGVFFTRRTYGVRVNLTGIQKEIFELGEINYDIQDLYLNFSENEEPCESQIKGEIQFCSQDDNNFQPTDTRAHITLGCAPNVSAVTTGLDLIDILKLEEEPSLFCSKIQAEQGNLIQMGDDCGTFVYYLKRKMVANSTFKAYYNNAVKKLEAPGWWMAVILFKLLINLTT